MDLFDNLGIGTDCEEISRFENLADNFLQRIFTTTEISYCESKMKPSQHFAVRFSAKESIIKAFSEFGIKLDMKKIEISHNSDGSPKVKLGYNFSKSFQIKISLSHSNTMATSFAIVNKQS